MLWEGVPDRVIGTSKTFKQLARLSGAPAQRKGPFVRRSVTAADLGAWIPQLAGLSTRERAKLRGVSRSRSRQILAGAVVAKAAMKALNVDSVDVCPWALREGIILHYLQTTHNESFDLPLRPLTGTAYQEDRPGPRSNSHVALVTAPARRDDDHGARNSGQSEKNWCGAIPISSGAPGDGGFRGPRGFARPQWVPGRPCP